MKYMETVNFGSGQLESLALLGGKDIKYAMIGVPTPEERLQFQEKRREERRQQEAKRLRQQQAQ